MSDVQKEFYVKTIGYRYENVLLPTYQKLVDIDIGDTNNDIDSEISKGDYDK